MHEMWNVRYAKADLMFLGVERDTLRRIKDIKKKKSKLIWKAHAKKHLKFIITIVTLEFSFMTHTIVSKQTPRATFRQLKFKLSQVFPISQL